MVGLLLICGFIFLNLFLYVGKQTQNLTCIRARLAKILNYCKTVYLVFLCQY